jgi:hypothetical protein
MKRLGRVVLAVVGLVVGAIGVLALREATLSTHRTVTDAERTTLVIEAEVKGTEHNQTLDETVEAILTACRLEVSSDLEGDPRPLGDGVYEASLVPPLDESNRRQFRGCLEDWTLDHLLVDVLRIESTV